MGSGSTDDAIGGGHAPRHREDRQMTDAQSNATAWFRQAAFGLFIHWGPFSGSNTPRVSAESCVDPSTFNAELFDAQSWAQIARQAGMRYVIFTSKHADDFALFDSPATDHCNDATRFGHPDYVATIADAFRAEGLRIHWYYGVTMNIPLFSGLRGKNELRAAKLSKKQAEEAVKGLLQKGLQDLLKKQ